jgi:hypothetical protein
MTLEELYFVSQTIAAVAIVASLLYVALQLRQTERNQRAIIQQGRATRNLTLTMRQTEVEMAALMAKAGTEWSSMSDVELLQFIGWTRGILFHFEDSYLQHLDGLMDERAFESARSSLASILSRPASRATWEVTRTFHSPAFVAYVDKLVRDAPLSPGVLTTNWKAKMAELTGGDRPEGVLPA